MAVHVYSYVNYYYKGPLEFYSDQDKDNNLPAPPTYPKKPSYQRKNESLESFYNRQKEWEANRPPEVIQEIQGAHMTQAYYTKHLLPLYIEAIKKARQQDPSKNWLLQEDNDPSHGTRSSHNVVTAKKQEHQIKSLITAQRRTVLSPLQAAAAAAAAAAAMTTVIRVPCSSANIGPGFDVIGLALNVYLEVAVTVSAKTASEHSLNCRITYEGVGAESVPLVPEDNLITRTAVYVLRCHGIRAFPAETHVHIKNPIPLGRGLGSSGAAIVAGVNLANEVGDLRLTKARMLDYCLMEERHPDNVAAALYGGFVGTYLNELTPEDTERLEIPLSEVLPEPAGGVDTGLRPPEPPHDIGHFKKFKWAPEIKCICIIPDFEVSTAKAREVLPTTFSRKDAIFNMQRLALLTSALGDSPPDPDMIYTAMQDKLHQPYRRGLIPGLTEILQSVTPQSHPGLLGICLSGAGPTILALATHNFDAIASHLLEQFKKENITCEWKLLQPAEEGTTVVRPSSPLQLQGGEALTYESSGVSIDAGNQLVKQIKASVASTRRPGADAEIGGFGGLLDLQAAGYTEAPILVGAIDGIGTKVKIAFEMGKHDTVGIDLVAMNVNDLVVQGAEPLMFLDYYACSKLDVESAAAFVRGVADGCRQSACALVGGETAEMPGLYQAGEYDAGGAAIGAIKKGTTILPDKQAMEAGDVLLGLASNGAHSNGFSLIRKIIETKGLSFHDAAPWSLEESVGTSLLAPTKIYVKSLLAATRKGMIKGMAHITGGGLLENIPRMLPDTLAAELDAKTWAVPKVFLWLKEAGRIEDKEFARTWNTGLGMVLVVDSRNARATTEILQEYGETVFTVGSLVKRKEADCVVQNMHVWR
ncbi:phosphoribosylformylglycinamidine cyclo-ligase-like protein [Clohesyomyces aquaticus]|uniref:Homoserine kinase n=1 Tax=Clohesyomyces aquaticus TaxID=1231657 RepID=A0A1Y1ZCS7_9PLEO|nr:phosphoribosylformylglycinamidine cyclo-ligase-like protein [Clohesyomyces aquaticus]